MAHWSSPRAAPAPALRDRAALGVTYPQGHLPWPSQGFLEEKCIYGNCKVHLENCGGALRWLLHLWGAWMLGNTWMAKGKIRLGREKENNL